MRVWASLATFGVSAFRETIDRNLDHVHLAQRLIEADPDLQLMNPANLGIVCFRRRVDGLTEAQTARANSWLVGSADPDVRPARNECAEQ